MERNTHVKDADLFLSESREAPPDPPAGTAWPSALGKEQAERQSPQRDDQTLPKDGWENIKEVNLAAASCGYLCCRTSSLSVIPAKAGVRVYGFPPGSILTNVG